MDFFQTSDITLVSTDAEVNSTPIPADEEHGYNHDAFSWCVVV
ncbi:hypothetical protein EWM64_g5518 [Hericium alpestre]|uniref:Uncharacterized protein n=1 Tax=Hericium alpestre TaxID=135208 RepID=A0A4Y9ZWD3_9AGAM|nr:hypothetical protein EWM64_g5518 [Hericium alpestre]